VLRRAVGLPSRGPDHAQTRSGGAGGSENIGHAAGTSEVVVQGVREGLEIPRGQDVGRGRIGVSAERFPATGEIEAVHCFRDAFSVDLRPAAEAGEREPLAAPRDRPRRRPRR